MNQLDPQVRLVWSISTFSRWLLFSIFVLIIEFLNSRFEIFAVLPRPGIIAAIVFFIGIIMSLLFPILYYKYFKFEVREQELYIERGILTKIKTIAPFRRIQHLDVHQSIIERMMSLSKLIIYTAGTRGADIVIPGLPIQYAEMLRDQLKNYTVEDAV